jgi:hypothetical protein
MIREPLTTAQTTDAAEHVNGLENPELDSAGLKILFAVARLLKLGLITNTASKLQPPNFRLTPRGLQYMADFEVMRLEADGFEIETEIFIKARKLGLKVEEVPSVELTRRYGESKLRGVHGSLRIFKTILHELNPERRKTTFEDRDDPRPLSQ